YALHLSFFFSSRRRHTRSKRDWSSDVCSSDLGNRVGVIHQGARQVLRGAGIDDRHAAQHLAHDDLDVLVVDSHTLIAVHLLHLVDQVLLHATATHHTKHLVRIRSALQQLLAHLHMVTVAERTLHAA